ncbi:phosphotransferase [Nocardioides psychrotolerans]|uniref:Predicted kinase, aminoglycoside phosphotransferase (APT) family n=1 Tax=Nocardioides psychrotolerans TaxID=1005945 RepID=A0A1I3REP2_9ACTN|nr:aminoglycoside phosphotransferase family protein [Nocardioides psychrotolerans]GEP40442.1 phosphotransferase [Nocardioides psychrotolerans]SFJ44480.1 Predicted kinase, aminoglycoside phosphotransferase (APT) family [Nocardioides psychrotolerans]
MSTDGHADQPRLHADELPIDTGLVRRLVSRAFPDLAVLDLRPVAGSGSSNALFHLGDDLVVRLPRQPGGGVGIVKESRWLPVVAGAVEVAVPEIVGVGEPDLGYPERWSIARWLPGDVATPAKTGSVPLGVDLARFLAALRTVAVPEGTVSAELSSYRALPLVDLNPDFRELVEECGPLDVGIDLHEALRVWELATDACSTTAEPVFLHGDLVAENLLVRDGRLTGVLDLGGLAVGDPTVDLVVAWEVLDEAGRAALRRELDVDDATWTTSRGWALLIALMTFAYYGETMPRRCADRLVMARAALAG